MLSRREVLAGSFAALAVLTGCSSRQPAAVQATPAPAATPTTAAVRFDPAGLQSRLDSGEDIYLLDVRTPAELEATGMIEGAVNIPIDQLEVRLSEVPKDRPIAVY